MIIKLLLIIVLVVAIIPTQDIPYPDPDPICHTEWALLWTFPSEKYCGGGDYYLFWCNYALPRPHYQAVCLSSIREQREYKFYFPFIGCER